MSERCATVTFNVTRDRRHGHRGPLPESRPPATGRGAGSVCRAAADSELTLSDPGPALTGLAAVTTERPRPPARPAGAGPAARHLRQCHRRYYVTTVPGPCQPPPGARRARLRPLPGSLGDSDSYRDCRRRQSRGQPRRRARPGGGTIRRCRRRGGRRSISRAGPALTVTLAPQPVPGSEAG